MAEMYLFLEKIKDHEKDLSNLIVNLFQIQPENGTDGCPNFCGDEELEFAWLSEKIKFLPDGCFEYCKKLREVILPSGLEFIYSSAFARSGLRKVVIPRKLKDTGFNLFGGCLLLKEITLPRKLFLKNSDFINKLEISPHSIFLETIHLH